MVYSNDFDSLVQILSSYRPNVLLFLSAIEANSLSLEASHVVRNLSSKKKPADS